MHITGRIDHRDKLIMVEESVHPWFFIEYGDLNKYDVNISFLMHKIWAYSNSLAIEALLSKTNKILLHQSLFNLPIFGTGFKFQRLNAKKHGHKEYNFSRESYTKMLKLWCCEYA